MCDLGGTSKSQPSTQLLRPVVMGAEKKRTRVEEPISEESNGLSEEDRKRYTSGGMDDLIDNGGLLEEENIAINESTIPQTPSAAEKEEHAFQDK